MTKYRDDILEHLEFAIRRDAVKGGNGWRSTVDIAEGLGVTTAVARRALHAMLDANLLDWTDELGRTLHWHLAEPDDGEREPVNDNHPAALARTA